LLELAAVIEQSATCLLHHEQQQMVALVTELAKQVWMFRITNLVVKKKYFRL